MQNHLRFLIPLGALAVILPTGFWPFLAASSGGAFASPLAGVLLASLAICAAAYLRHVAALVIAYFNEVVGVFSSIGERPMQGDLLRNIAQWTFLGVLREKDWALYLEYSQTAVWGAAVVAAAVSLLPAAEKLAVLTGLLDPHATGFPGTLSWHDLIWTMPSALLLTVLRVLPPCGRVAVRTDEQLARLMLKVLERLTEWRMTLKNAIVTFADSGFDESIDMLRDALLEWHVRRKRGQPGSCDGEK